jgi:hypothetical protein
MVNVVWLHLWNLLLSLISSIKLWNQAQNLTYLNNLFVVIGDCWGLIKLSFFLTMILCCCKMIYKHGWRCF